MQKSAHACVSSFLSCYSAHIRRFMKMKMVLSGNQLEVIHYPHVEKKKSQSDYDWELFQRDQPEKYKEYIEKKKDEKLLASVLKMTPDQIIEEMEMFALNMSDAIEHRAKRMKETSKIHSLERSAKRAEREISRLINANLGCFDTEYFVTLTYASEMEDRDKAMIHLKRFVEKVRKRKGGEHFEYIGVTEIQTKRFEETGKAVLHFHLIAFNSGFSVNKKKYPNPDLEKIWKHGRCDVRPITSKGIATYLSKYLSKDMLSAVSFNHKRYFSSRGVKKPLVKTIEYNSDLISFLKENLEYKKIIFHDYLGDMFFERYSISVDKINKINQYFL